jgi:hypothetical protein
MCLVFVVVDPFEGFNSAAERFMRFGNELVMHTRAKGVINFCSTESEITVVFFTFRQRALGNFSPCFIPCYQYFMAETDAMEKYDHYFSQLPIEEIDISKPIYI